MHILTPMNAPTKKLAKKKKKKAKSSKVSPDRSSGDSIQLSRLEKLRVVNDSVERFQIFARACGDRAELKRVFDAYRRCILSALCLRLESGERLAADILEVDPNDWTLKLTCGTKPEHADFVPTDMKMTLGEDGKFKKPKDRAGVAAYCVWANSTGNRGIAVANDVKDSGEIDFYRETSDTDNAAAMYDPEPAGKMFRKPPYDAPAPYRSLLCAPILILKTSHGHPGADVLFACIGTLNITHSDPNAFGVVDCVWSRTCASLLGSLYESYRYRLAGIDAGDGPADQERDEVIYSEQRDSQEPYCVAIDSFPESGEAAPPTQDSALETARGDENFTKGALRDGQIQPWDILQEQDFLVHREKFDAEAERAVLEKLQRFGFALVRLTALTPESELLTSLEHSLGPACAEQNDYNESKIKPIIPDPQKEAISGESGKELGAHVDGTQDNPLPPAMLAFQYMAGATHGGHSTFIDMADVLRNLSEGDLAKTLADLSQHDAAVCKKEKTREDGSVWKGSFSGPLIKPVCGDRAVSFRVRFDRVLKVPKKYQDSFEILQTAVLSRGQDRKLVFIPQVGDIAIFDNWRVLHGRLAVAGRHERHHNRIWLKELATRHQGRTVLGVRGLSLDSLHLIKKNNLHTSKRED